MAKVKAKVKMPKAPKPPKASAPLASWEAYDDRLNAWKKRCSEKQKAADKKISDAQKAKTRKASLIAGTKKKRVIKP